MSECKAVSTPMAIGQKLSSEMCPSEMENVPYMQGVGSLFRSEFVKPFLCEPWQNSLDCS